MTLSETEFGVVHMDWYTVVYRAYRYSRRMPNIRGIAYMLSMAISLLLANAK